MPSPAETAPAPAPGFDAEVFWIKHKKNVLRFVLLFVVALAAWSVSEWFRMQKLTGSQNLLAGAKTVEDFQKLIATYPGTAAAGNAHLLAAAQLRKDGKVDESSALLRSFTEKYPEHPLLSGAWTSLAANLEAQGKADEALAMYQKISTSYAGSFSAPVALMAQGRLLKAKGKTEEAGKIYEQVVARYAETPIAQQAAQEIKQLKK